MLSRIYKQLQTLLVLFTLTQTTYSYAYTVAGKCESAIRHITISRVATPTVTQTAHTLCGGGSQTIASLQPQDANIVWYNSATGGSPLASTTPLVAGTTYYVAQRNGTYESDKIAVTVTQRASGNETLNFQATNNSLNCIPTGQLRFQIQSPVAGKTYVVELVEMPATYTGTRTFTITETDKDKTISFVKFTGYNMPAGNYKAKLHTYNIANGQPVPATIALMQRDFPAPNRSNNDFGSDQVYQDIQRGGQTSCDYLDIRYGYNTNSPFYKYFNTPELLALYEYTAYSDDDLANKYGGNPNDTRIVWRDLFTLPEGTSSVVGKKIIYYDLAAHNRTYKDLKEDPKRPKFYFRIKGQNCNNNSDPMLAGDMRFMNASIVYGGSCKAPEMSVTNENPMVCYPITYVIKHNGVKVGEGQINSARERKKITTLDNGQPFKADQEYEVTFTSVDGQTVTKKETYNTFYNTVRPGGGYTQETRCFGSNEVPKGRIDIYFRQKQWGSILSMNGFKVTLLEAPAGYVEEPGKLKLNETVTIKYQNPSKVITNIMATHNQDDLTQNFSLPEGTYKIKVEDLCGNVTYVYSGRDDSKEEFNLVYPSYQEKPLTPKTETDCAKVRVYPFRGNPTFDWLKAENKNRSVYVYLYKRPDGIAEEDVTVSSNLSQQVGATTYIKAVYNPNDPTSADQYFSLPRNQNSEGSYTFVYGGKIDINSNEQDIIRYIASSGTNGCVRTFTISIDDVLLNFDRNGYIGYKCEDNTGKIVVKAINGIGGSGNYQYDLYNVKNGTLIESKTAAKGTAVTFTNLGTFTGGQNSRWVKITDSECPTDPVWKELPITPLDNPELVLASPLQSGYCKGSTVTITLRSLGAPSYQWKYPDGTTTVTTLPQLVIPSIDAQHAGIYQVVAQGLVCAANTVTFSYTVNILEKPASGNTYTFCAAATVADLKAKIATDTATVKVYKNGTLVTDNTEALSTTDTYKVSRFNAVCETDKVVVTIVFSNTVTLTVPTALTVTCTATNIDTVVSNWLNQATVTDTCATATLTHDFAAVKPTNWCNTSVVTVTFVGKDPQGNTVTKTSVIKVGSAPIVAKDDTYTVTNGLTGGTTPSVLTNDSLNGNNNPSTSSVTLTWTTATPTGFTLNPNGTITVAPNTPAGTYTISYKICAVASPTVCDTADIVVTVTGTTTSTTTPTTIEANDDVATVSSTTGGTTSSVLTNDKLNGVPNPSISSVTLTWNTATPTGFTLNPNGTITVAPNTPAGTYTISYKICAVASSTVCDTADIVVTVTGTTTSTTTPTTIEANDDGVTTITSTTGGTTPSVLTNDKLNGVPNPSISSVTLTWNTATPTGFTLNPNGTITVAPNTPAGTYTISYKICAVVSPTVCDTADIVVTVTGTTTSTTTPTTIEANDDGVTTITSTTGGTTPSVLTNDKLNGVPNPSISSVTLTWNTATPTGFTLNPNGTITVAPNTPAGTYTISYKICAVASTTVCDTADIVVTVTGTTTSTTTPTTIEANDDVATVSSTTGGTTSSVLTNDKLNGVPNPSISSVTLTWTTATPTGFTLNPNGTITVAPNTPAGTYTISYKICAVASSTVCDTADIVVTVTGTTTSTTTPTTIEANDDVATVSSTTGGTTSSVLTNDKLNGVPNPSVSSVTLTWTTATPTGFTLNPNGTITIAPNTPAGTYTISYKICAVASSTVCDTADIVVTVTGTTTSTTTPTTIEANDDVATVSSTTGGTTSSVLTNDKLNGVPSPSISSVTLTWNTATPTGFTLNPNGTITIAPNTPAGTYTISYKICAVASSTVCDTADIVVTVTGTTTSTTTPTTIEANDDGVTTITSTTGGTTPSVLTNDKLNGVPNPSISSVTLTWNTATPTGFTLNPNGTISVAPNTPAGTYTISYKICAVVSPTVCDTADIVVTVTGTTTSTTTPTTIEANDDGVTTITSTTGGTTPSVLTNDKLNGVPNPSISSVTLTWNTATPTGFTLNPNGTITVAPNTPAGTYTISYKICAVASTTVCDTADIVVTVTGTTTSTTTPTTIEANDDVATVSSTTGGTTSSVLTNDKLNGVPNPSISSVTLTWTTATPTGFTLNPNGTITVAPNTPAGTYTISYKICAVASSTVCDTADIVVTVTGTTTSTTTPTTIEANDDVATVSSTTGGTTSSVLTNDKLNGVPNPSVSSVTLTWTTATPTGFTLNPNGTITIAPNTPAGTYTISYKICAVASSTVCDTADIVVTVTGTTTSTTTPTTIEANDDVATVSSTTGGTTSSVLTNDKLNGVPSPSISSVTLTWNTATPTGFTLNPNGTITIAPNTPAGTYTISYKICAVASSTVCDTADIVVTVTGTTTSTTTPTTIEANDDGVTTITSTTGGTTPSVLTNDKLNGVPNPSISSVTLTWTTATPTGFTLNPNGTITVAPNTPAGTYTISYKICAVASSTVCDTADIVVTITGTTTSTTTPTTIEANDDVATVSSTTGGTTSSVLTNDKLNGVPNPSVSSVTLTWTTATPTGFTLNPNGTITVAPNTPAGTYTISYKICAVASSTVCDTADIVVTITGTTTSTTTPTTIEANDDVATVSSTTGGTTSSVLTNDKLNGVPNPSISSVTLTWTTATPTGFTLNPNGTITVAPNTPAGTYTISYKICAVASPTVCDTANIVVTVIGTTTSTTPVLPVAADDRTTTPIDTPVAVNVLANDTPNGATAPNVVTNPTNGTTVVNPDGTIEYRPHTGFVGIDTFVYELCNTDGCASATVTIEVVNKLVPYNGMSVDGDGKNEHFHIAGINRYPDNVVRIYNRWGVKVFETEGYDNVTRVFRGFSNGRVVVETSDKLPQGTYYYVIEYVDENRQKRSEVGWLYLKR